MKTFLKLLLLTAMAAYLVFSFFKLSNTTDVAVCEELKVTMVDTLHKGFITPSEVERLLHKAGLHPVGKSMDSIDALKIERLLQENPFVKHTTCYKMPGGKVNVIVAQRLPIMRIMPANSSCYYVDERGEAMKPLNYNADLVVATGHVDSTFIKEKLINFGLYLKENEFWNDQITQINVLPNHHVDLVTRVGSNLLVHFGEADSIARKFNNLKTFYEKVLPEVGWNTYKEINLEYVNQIVCKKR